MNAAMPSEIPQEQHFDAAELGAMMREIRENLGRELSEVAEDLRIRQTYLEAIEAGRLSDLPGSAYVSGFLRAYSDYLGLDGDEIVRRFRMAGVSINRTTNLHLPSPVEEGRLPTASILLLALVFCAAAYGGWYYLSSHGRDPVESVTALPAEFARLVGLSGDTPGPREASEGAAGAAAAPPRPAPTPSEQGFTSRASEPEATAAPEPAPPPVPRTPPSGPRIPPAPKIAAESAPPTTPVAPAPAQLARVPGPATDRSAKPPASEPAPTSARDGRDGARGESRPAAEPAREEPAPPPEPPAERAAATPAGTTSQPAPAAERTAAVPAPEPAREAPPAAPAMPEQPPAPPEPPEAGAAAETRETTASAGPSTGGQVQRIVVRATADSFVAVMTSDDQPLFQQLMRPGDTYEVPSGANLKLETGNAGGLEISIGGRQAPSLGPMGAVRRNVPLDAEKLLRGIQ